MATQYAGGLVGVGLGKKKKKKKVVHKSQFVSVVAVNSGVIYYYF